MEKNLEMETTLRTRKGRAKLKAISRKEMVKLRVEISETEHTKQQEEISEPQN